MNLKEIEDGNFLDEADVIEQLIAKVKELEKQKEGWYQMEDGYLAQLKIAVEALEMYANGDKGGEYAIEALAKIKGEK